MKIVKIEEMVIDRVESDHEHPCQCEFDIAGLNANYFIITMDSELVKLLWIGFRRCISIICKR